MSTLNPSVVREMLKVKADISFSAGSPSDETFPAQEMAELAEGIFKNNASSALQYGITEGYDPLRKLTFERMSKKYSVGSEADDIIITSGGQQGIDLAMKCLANEGDAVVCENPSFVGALNDFRSYSTRLLDVPMQPDGMDLDRLENILNTEQNVKIIYTISTFQNPSGITMSLDKRQRLYEIAVKYNVMILEDSPYFELRYSGKYIPNIKSLDKTGHVIFVGSYSKIISPGIRVGFAIADKTLISKMTMAKQVQDVHTNLFFQILLAKYMENYDLDKHINDCRNLYSAKKDRMIRGLDKHLPKCVSFTRPEGGLFVWGELPEHYTGRELCKYTSARSLAIVPGMALDVYESPDNRGFRLNFSIPTMAQIDRGTALLGDAVREYLEIK